LGCAFILNLIEAIDTRVKACFFVSGFIGSLDNPTFDKVNRSFCNKEFNWKTIRKRCNRFVLFHSDNDPYVPFVKAEELQKNLGAELLLVKGAGHFNEKTGYTNFEKLKEKIKETQMD
jgi:predicted alpha/beta hydrolase family esterase